MWSSCVTACFKWFPVWGFTRAKLGAAGASSSLPSTSSKLWADFIYCLTDLPMKPQSRPRYQVWSSSRLRFLQQRCYFGLVAFPQIILEQVFVLVMCCVCFLVLLTKASPVAWVSWKFDLCPLISKWQEWKLLGFVDFVTAGVLTVSVHQELLALCLHKWKKRVWTGFSFSELQWCWLQSLGAFIL